MAGDSVISPQRSKDFGRLDHGCDHYKRRCKILAPCCNKTFPCRHCHNETSNSLSNPKDHHDLVRQDVKQVICSICNTQQEVAQVCSHCGVNMGEYFCDICKFYDDDITKGQFHCNDRGICRVGGRDKFFHCEKCGSCYMVDLRDNHFCVENSMKSYCPICFEIDATRMPAEYQFEVSILCNDCNSTSTVQFHVLGLKCRKCNSYNTRRVTEPANHCHTY
ncbi:hypothetical protein E1A91_A08G084100v1 [Gossypium mustelinum]|uniref:CHY-type domain-containing protein n=1 Tax=Gossypium mustelinum TaxID=34275 RepID=A0A5D2Y653_GOSMU|nr:hypothetical protein E1A91_A08G084100v1 [Gossypium mustelinum]